MCTRRERATSPWGRRGGRRERKKEEYTAERAPVYNFISRRPGARRVGIGATPTCVSLGRQPKLRLSFRCTAALDASVCYCSRYFSALTESLFSCFSFFSFRRRTFFFFRLHRPVLPRTVIVHALRSRGALSSSLISH